MNVVVEHDLDLLKRLCEKAGDEGAVYYSTHSDLKELLSYPEGEAKLKIALWRLRDAGLLWLIGRRYTEERLLARLAPTKILLYWLEQGDIQFCYYGELTERTGLANCQLLVEGLLKRRQVVLDSTLRGAHGKTYHTLSLVRENQELTEGAVS